MKVYSIPVSVCYFSSNSPRNGGCN